MSPSDAATAETEETEAPSAPVDMTKHLADAAAAGSIDGLPNDALQQLLSDAVRVYAARAQAGDKFRPFPASAGLTATDVMIASTAMLKAVNLQLFELGMWQAWSGNF